jgi:hypothetical protein
MIFLSHQGTKRNSMIDSSDYADKLTQAALAARQPDSEGGITTKSA